MTITIQLPDELLALCERDKTTPEAILRGFIGDLCGATSADFDRGRVDGYGSHGSDERSLAWQYYDRCGYNRAQFASA